MKKLFLFLILLSAPLAHAGGPPSPTPWPSMPPTPPQPTPMPSPSPRPCSAGLPVGAPPVRTERSISSVTKEITFESYVYINSDVVHRIQTSRISQDLSWGTATGPYTGSACQRYSTVLTKIKERKMPMWGNCSWSAWKEQTTVNDRTNVMAVYRPRTGGGWELVESNYEYSRGVAMMAMDYSYYRKWVRVLDGNYYGSLTIDRHNGDFEHAKTPCQWTKRVGGVTTQVLAPGSCNQPSAPYPQSNLARLKAFIGGLDDDIQCRASLDR